MTKIDIISGFLGAGKTTLIKKLIKEAYGNEKLVLIENEFGEIGIDGGFLKEAGIEIKEMNSGCICCSLVGDFGESLKKVMEEFTPERIIIEPSGVGKLSDVIKAVQDLHNEQMVLNSYTTVVDGKKAKLYMKNFGEFFNNQVEYANTIIVSRAQMMKKEQLEEVVALLQEKNEHASIITTAWDDLGGEKILSVMEHAHDLATEMMEELEICPVCHHHHDEGEHHHEHECGCEHHHEHEHHDHDHEHECGCGHHHDHHHADEVFTSWGKETVQHYTEAQLKEMLEKLSKEDNYGTILRAKGIVPSDTLEWLYFDLVPGEYEVRSGNPETIGKLCVIGSDLKEDALASLFQLA